MNNPDDPFLFNLAAGQSEAFGILYDQFASRLFGAAVRMLGTHQDAEDVVQEVFIAMVRSRKQLTEVEDMAAYLFTTLRHAAARYASRRARQPATTENTPEEIVTTPRQYDHPQGEKLQRAMATLPDNQREVIALKIEGELTFAQIAQVLNVSPNTAASRYRYALEKLRTTLHETSKGERA